MAKGKKKKKDKIGSAGAASGKVTKRLRNMSKNPLVADIVAATLVAAAAALKDSKKARQLAANAGDELEELASRGARQGNALWQLALDVGRKSAEALIGDDGAEPKKAKARGGGSKPKKSAAKSSARLAAKTKAKPKARAGRPKAGSRK